ncbi:MAG: hypothetical protein ACLFPX_01760 [Candidatus Omnitrophota bacterium]
MNSTSANPLKLIQHIQTPCVMTPYLYAGLTDTLGAEHLKRYRPYRIGGNRKAAIIETGIGAPYVADAVLNLGRECPLAIFVGSCGALSLQGELQVGSIVSLNQIAANESLASVLQKGLTADRLVRSDTSWQKNLFTLKPEIAAVRGASLPSITLEESWQDWLLKNDIKVVDLESAAFLSAAAHKKIPALVILYVTDIIGEDDPYDRPSDQKIQAVRKGQEMITGILQDLLALV